MRDPDGTNDAKDAKTSTLCDDQVGPPFRHRNARFGEDEWALQVSRFEKGTNNDFATLLDPDLPLQLHE